jgi:glutaredoxin 3
MIDKCGRATHSHTLLLGVFLVAKVEIYTKFLCSYCARAKALLVGKGVDFIEIDVTMDAALRNKMIARSAGGTTVPQIFIDGQHVGGSDDLASLDARGGLDPLLAAQD